MPDMFLYVGMNHFLGRQTDTNRPGTILIILLVMNITGSFVDKNMIVFLQSSAKLIP